MKTKPSKHTTAALVLMVLSGYLLLLPGAVSFAQTGRINATAFPHVEDEILVRFKSGIARNAMASVHASWGAQVLKNFRIVERLQQVKLPRAVSVDEALEMYRQRADVLYAEPNYIVEALTAPNDPSFGSLWGLLNTGQFGGTPGADIDAPRAWDITTGNGSVVVAVIDTGIDYNHEDLSANMFRNTADCNSNGVDDDGNGYTDDCFGIDTANNDRDPMDDHNHGTHVAGTIGAVGNNALGVVGVNWNVRLLACKFLSAGGSGSTAGAIACLDYVKTMKDRGVNIVATNNSWGGGGFSQALYEAIDAHRQSGVLFIAAAGNAASNNDSSTFYPAGYYLPNIIAVAATDRVDHLAYFSNYGRTTVHLGAPGHEILSTIRANGYLTASGTSMATPHVTGLAALLKAQDPNRDWRAIKNLILAGSDDNVALDNTITGKRLNAFGALACVDAPVFSRLKPILNMVSGEIDTPTPIAALNINCAEPRGPVPVRVSPSGEVVTLLDDGLNSDQAAGDGIYSGQFTPTDFGTFTLSFPDGDVVTVVVRAPQISVVPSTLNFGNVIVNANATANFTVQNIGGGILSGAASTSTPFSIIAGASYALGPGQSQIVTVRFSPPSAATFNSNVAFTGGDGSANTVIGVGIICPPSTPIAFGETKAGALSQVDCKAPDRPESFTDLYTFSGTAGQLVQIFLSSTAFDTYLFLKDPSGTVIASNDDCLGTNSCIPSNAPTGGKLFLASAGTYTIEVASYYPLETGNYTIGLNPVSTLNVSKIGTGTGLVISSPAGITCGTDCTEDYLRGTVVNLAATADAESIFAGWSGACSGQLTCTLTMNAAYSVTAIFVKPLVLDSTPPPTGEAGVPYNFDLSITGGLPPYNVSVINGALPPGLSFSSPKITGTPASAAKASFTVHVTDQLGTSVTHAYKMKILAALNIATTALKPGTNGKAYKGALKAKGGAKPYNWTLAGGALPLGLALNSATGALTGIPTQTGIFNLTFHVTDPVGGVAQKPLTLTIK